MVRSGQPRLRLSGKGHQNRKGSGITLTGLNEGPTNEQLLIYALPGLKKLAQGQNTEAKEWLRYMLTNCRDTREKQSLQKLLAASRKP